MATVELDSTHIIPLVLAICKPRVIPQIPLVLACIMYAENATMKFQTMFLKASTYFICEGAFVLCLGLIA
jgi:hypothetical protein